MIAALGRTTGSRTPGGHTSEGVARGRRRALVARGGSRGFRTSERSDVSVHADAGRGHAGTDRRLDGKRPPEWVEEAGPDEVAKWLGLVPHAPGLVAWDVFDAVLTPGDIILLASWRDQAVAEAFEAGELEPLYTVDWLINGPDDRLRRYADDRAVQPVGTRQA